MPRGGPDLSDDRIHPDDDLLRDFAAVVLGGDVLDQVADHLGQCRCCRAIIDRLSAGAGFLGRLRVVSESDCDTPERAVERRGAVRALRQDAERESGSDCESAAEPVAIPREVGPYLILREVGRGGMGVVYQAGHGSLGRLVALKMILADEFASEVQRRRFHREAEPAGRPPGCITVRSSRSKSRMIERGVLRGRTSFVYDVAIRRSFGDLRDFAASSPVNGSAAHATHE